MKIFNNSPPRDDKSFDTGTNLSRDGLRVPVSTSLNFAVFSLVR